MESSNHLDSWLPKAACLLVYNLVIVMVCFFFIYANTEYAKSYGISGMPCRGSSTGKKALCDFFLVLLFALDVSKHCTELSTVLTRVLGI